MKVRAITAGVSLKDLSSPSRKRIQNAAAVLKQAKRALADAGIEVQSVRLATGLISNSSVTPAKIPTLAASLENVCVNAGIDYVSTGRLPPSLSEAPKIDAIAEAICRTESVFASVEAATARHGVNKQAIDSAAHAVISISKGTPDGFGNLRFAVVACGPDVTPYFPTSYNPGVVPSISVCLESADVPLEQMESVYQKVSSVLERSLKSSGFAYAGIDLSPAPYPSAKLSVGTLIEKRSSVPLGEPGTLAAVEAVTSAMRKLKVKNCGFNGLMFPVLEDLIVAKRVKEGRLDLQELMLYSAVCGTGLDTIPLPGDTPAPALARIMTDVCSLSVRLNKPLTARLMPIPGKKAGDMTNFDFQFFANTRVMRVSGSI